MNITETESLEIADMIRDKANVIAVFLEKPDIPQAVAHALHREHVRLVDLSLKLTPAKTDQDHFEHLAHILEHSAHRITSGGAES